MTRRVFYETAVEDLTLPTDVGGPGRECRSLHQETGVSPQKLQESFPLSEKGDIMKGGRVSGVGTIPSNHGPWRAAVTQRSVWVSSLIFRQEMAMYVRIRKPC